MLPYTLIDSGEHVDILLLRRFETPRRIRVHQLLLKVGRVQELGKIITEPRHLNMGIVGPRDSDRLSMCIWVVVADLISVCSHCRVKVTFFILLFFGIRVVVKCEAISLGV
jgi:hypothetical protein